jgi:probable F420-dependent oxidoreductase
VEECKQVPKIDLGPIGAVVSPGEGRGWVDEAIGLEDLGYSTIWVTGGQMGNLVQMTTAVRATRRVRVASAILSVDRFGVDEVEALYRDLGADYPGRLVVGLGGAHGPDPLATLARYLDRLAAVPAGARVLAALGPRMLDLARERAGGALPVLVTPRYTAQARSRLGDDTTLAIDQLVVVETDPEGARATARGTLGFLGRLPAYQANFRRMGFSDSEIARLADPLVDALVSWRDADTVAGGVAEHLRAGADHVAVSVMTGPTTAPAIDQWRQLSERLIGA